MCEICRMLNQTLSYLDHFARFTQKENVEAVERLLSAHKDLAKFERAQLGKGHTLSPTQFLALYLTGSRIPMLRECRRGQDADSVARRQDQGR